MTGGAAELRAPDGVDLDVEGTTVGPGQVNAHTHIYSALAPLGMPEPTRAPESFPQILESIWWRLDRALDADSLAASARLYAAEALLAGTTVLIDHHESPSFIDGSLEVIAEGCAEVGIRALLCYGATERNDGQAEAERGLAECRRFRESNRRPGIEGVVGLHASFTVSDATVKAAARLCEALDTVMHVHLAEDLCDVEDARSRGYEGPLERLLRLNALPAGSICAHGVHLDEGQVRAQADAGGWIVQNPRSNRGNRVGYPSALAAHPRVALGTDGYPSDLLEEERVLLEEAAQNGDDLETARGRRSAGLRLATERTGLGIAATEADEVFRDDDGVRHVIVGGKTVVKDGELLTADLEAIRRDANAQAQLLWERMRGLPETP